MLTGGGGSKGSGRADKEGKDGTSLHFSWSIIALPLLAKEKLETAEGGHRRRQERRFQHGRSMGNACDL